MASGAARSRSRSSSTRSRSTRARDLSVLPESSTGKTYLFLGDEEMNRAGRVWEGTNYRPDARLGGWRGADVGGLRAHRGRHRPDEHEEGGRYHLEDYGAHDIIVEDDVLYQAYYDGGVRIVDVSGELLGNLAEQVARSRCSSRTTRGGAARRRQRRGCRDRDRLRARRRASDRRQHRRRRLHGDPLPGRPHDRHRLPREGAAAAHPRCSSIPRRASTPRASITTATSRWACPARWPASTTRTEKYGAPTGASLVEPAVRWRATGSRHVPRSRARFAACCRDAALSGERRGVLERRHAVSRATWRQPDLARTLERIVRTGRDGFYTGETARLLVEEMERGGGIITMEDLALYQPRERDAGPRHVPRLRHHQHAAAEQRRRRDGADAEHPGGLRPAPHGPQHGALHPSPRGGDAARVPRPRALRRGPGLRRRARRAADEQGVRGQLRAHRPERARRVSAPTDLALPAESDQTTHYSVVDADGMAVSVTYTLERLRLEDRRARRGFLLNNEMGDFNARPGLTTEPV
jgi:hypothetical protein